MNGRGLGDGAPMTFTTQMADLVTAIAKARGLDLGRTGAHVRIAVPGHLALHIKVVAPALVSVAHYAYAGGKRLAVPRGLYYTGYGPQRGWLPVRWWNDVQGVYQHSTIVVKGKPFSYRHDEVRRAAAWADRWAQTLRERGYLEAVRRQQHGDEGHGT